MNVANVKVLPMTMLPIANERKTAMKKLMVATGVDTRQGRDCLCSAGEMMRRLVPTDYAVDAVTGAKALVGAWLCRRLEDGSVVPRIGISYASKRDQNRKWRFMHKKDIIISLYPNISFLALANVPVR